MIWDEDRRLPPWSSLASHHKQTNSPWNQGLKRATKVTLHWHGLPPVPGQICLPLACTCVKHKLDLSLDYSYYRNIISDKMKTEFFEMEEAFASLTTQPKADALHIIVTSLSSWFRHEPSLPPASLLVYEHPWVPSSSPVHRVCCCFYWLRKLNYGEIVTPYGVITCETVNIPFTKHKYKAFH